MKNPFDIHTEPEKFQFFHQMTSAINVWMLEKFPAFDESLILKMAKLESMQREAEAYYEKNRIEINRLRDSIQKETVNQINAFIQKEYPGISKEICSKLTEVEVLIAKISKNDEKVQKNLNKVIKSDSLYEDFYRMRDQVKALQDSFDEFKKTLSKLFK